MWQRSRGAGEEREGFSRRCPPWGCPAVGPGRRIISAPLKCAFRADAGTQGGPSRPYTHLTGHVPSPLSRSRRTNPHRRRPQMFIVPTALDMQRRRSRCAIPCHGPAARKARTDTARQKPFSVVTTFASLWCRHAEQIRGGQASEHRATAKGLPLLLHCR